MVVGSPVWLDVRCFWKLLPQHFPERCIVTRRGSSANQEGRSEGCCKMQCSAVTASCSWLVSGAVNSRRVAGCDSKTTAFTSPDLFALCWDYSQRKRSRDGSAPVAVRARHCSMPSLICLYLCSKSLLGLGGNVFCFPNRNVCLWEIAVFRDCNSDLDKYSSKSACKFNLTNAKILL